MNHTAFKLKQILEEVLEESSSRTKDLIDLKRLYNNPPEHINGKPVNKDKYRRMIKGKMMQAASDGHLDESIPKGFPTSLKKKLLSRYRRSPRLAYATMWKLHNKFGSKLDEMWMGF